MRSVGNTSNGTTVYQDGYKAIFSLLGMQLAANGQYIVSKYNPVPEKEQTQLPWAKWGDDNLFPKRVKEDIAKVGVMKRALKLRRDIHFGQGLITYKEEIIEGKVRLTPVRFPEFEEFRRMTWFDRTYLQLIGDFERYWNIFPELIFDRKGEKIAAIRRLDPHHCRWERMNESSLRIENLFLSKRWPRPQEGEYKKIPALDVDLPLLDLQGRVALGKVKPGSSFILPVRLQEDGNTYYDEAYWNSIRESWLPIASNVPAMKLAIMKNQMVLKYHIQIPYDYWPWRFKDEWENWDAKTRQKKVKEVLDEMNEFLTDVDNSGKGFISMYATDPGSGKKIGEWIITPIDNKLKDDAYLPDSQAANSEILFATGIDGTLIGQNSPGGSREGSGSNKREAFAIAQALIAADRMMVRSVLEFIRDFNGWDPDMMFGHKDLDTSQTLDENPTGKKTVMKQ